MTDAAEHPPAASVDLAVVGAGIAGCYVADRVLSVNPEWRVALFEAGRRIGGRLHTVHAGETGDASIELGGMRYRTSQPRITGLVTELRLETREFPTVHDGNRYLLRERRMTVGELAEHAGGLYGLHQEHRGMTPAELLVHAFETIVPGWSELDSASGAAVMAGQVFEGTPLYDQGLASVLRSVVGDEGYRLIKDGFGYSSIFQDWNAGHALPWFMIETRPDAENRTVLPGMQAVPEALAARFVAAGGSVHLGRRVDAIDGNSSAYRLRISSGEDVEARRVVLAVPLASLIEVLSDRVRLGGVTPYAMGKLFLTYDEPWWRDASVGGIRWVSDSPLRKTYLFDRADQDEERGPGLLLAAYCDGESLDHWRSRSDAAVRYDRTANLVSEAHAQVSHLFGVDNAPAPRQGFFADWSADALGAAWHAWDPGTRPWELVSEMIQPDPAERIYICGETYSSFQGWIEGALETAEMVVDRLAS